MSTRQLEYLKTLSIDEIKNACSNNPTINALCKQHKQEISDAIEIPCFI